MRHTPCSIDGCEARATKYLPTLCDRHTAAYNRWMADEAAALKEHA